VRNDWVCRAQLPQGTQSGQSAVPRPCGHCQTSKVRCVARDKGHSIISKDGRVVWEPKKLEGCMKMALAKPTSTGSQSDTRKPKPGPSAALHTLPTIHDVLVHNTPTSFAPMDTPQPSSSNMSLESPTTAAEQGIVKPEQPGKNKCELLLIFGHDNISKDHLRCSPSEPPEG
jgi:hypothetical protein